MTTRTRKRRIYATVEALRLAAKPRSFLAEVLGRFRRGKLMRYLQRSLGLGLLLLLFPAAAQAQNSYYMYCRGGGDIYTGNSVLFDKSGGGYVYWNIVKSKGNKYTLNPGECVWKDRVILSSEPSEMQLYVGPGNIPTVTWYRVPVGDGSHRLAASVAVDATWWFPSRSHFTTSVPAVWAWPDYTSDVTTNLDNPDYTLNSLMDPNMYLKFNVFIASGYLVVQNNLCSSWPKNQCW